MLQINILNYQTLKSKLENALKPEEIKKEFIKLGFKIEAGAKRDCPVDTGRLRSSISTNWSGSGMGKAKVGSPAKGVDGVSQPKKGDALVVVNIGTNVEYATYVEMGTRGRPPQSFLMPNARREIQNFVTKIDNIISLKKMF